MEVKEIPLDLVLPPEKPVRDMINPEGLEELKTTARKYGILQPIMLRPRNEKFEVVFGHRRYLAAVELGHTHINAYIFPADDEDTSILRLVENLSRTDLNPIEEAKEFDSLLQKPGWTEEAIASLIGKTGGYVSQRVSLLHGPEDIRLAVATGKIVFSVGRELQRLTDPQLRGYYLEQAANHGASTGVVRDWVGKALASSQGQAPLATANPEQPTSPKAPPWLGKCILCDKEEPVDRMTNLRVCVDDYQAVMGFVKAYREQN